MAITVTISKGYAWRMLIIGAACVVLGAWGVYDYAVDIPQRQQMHQQAALLELCRDALETEQAAGQLTPEAQEAVDAVAAEMETILNRELADGLGPEQTSPTPQQAAEVMQRFADEDSLDAQWVKMLNLIGQGLVAERGRPLNEQDHPRAYTAYEATEAGLSGIGRVTAPGKYDRITQWAFIACLPCAPYFFWCFFTARRRKYTLDDEGTLHAPQGTWSTDEITDIDMSRWMAKSTAWVVLGNGSRIKLDDYKFRGLHRIVGAIASRIHPGAWDDEAKPLDAAEDPAEPAAGEEVTGAAADAR